MSDVLPLPLAEQGGLHEHDRDGEPFLESGAFEAKIASLFVRPADLVFGSETAAGALHRFRSSLERALDANAGESIGVVSRGTVISLFVASVTGTDGFDLWRRLEMPSYVVLNLPGYELAEICRQDLNRSARQAARPLVLAALRSWQEESLTTDLAGYYKAYFEEHEPLASAEIDSNCARISAAATASPDLKPAPRTAPYIRCLYIPVADLHLF